MCAPGLGVLVERYQGFTNGMAGTKYDISKPYDVNTENTANYGAWENLAGANPKMVALVGLCSMDLPNIAKLKVRNQRSMADRWLRPRPRDARCGQSWHRAGRRWAASLFARLPAGRGAGAPFAQ